MTLFKEFFAGIEESKAAPLISSLDTKTADIAVSIFAGELTKLTALPS